MELQTPNENWESNGDLAFVEKCARAHGAIETGKGNSYRFKCTCGFETKHFKFIGRGSYSKLAALETFMKHKCG